MCTAEMSVEVKTLKAVNRNIFDSYWSVYPDWTEYELYWPSEVLAYLFQMKYIWYLVLRKNR